MKTIIKTISLSQTTKVVCLIGLFLMVTVLMVHAQPSDPGAIDNDAPIDGGLSLLVAGGIGYGVKKIRDKRKHNKAVL
jgi:hypothetical protein